MTARQKNLLIRTISAIVALILIFVLYSLWSVNGLKILIAFAVIMGTLEIENLLFKKQESSFLKIFFFILSLIIFASSAMSLSVGSLIFAFALTLMISAILLKSHKEGSLEGMLLTQSKASLGFFYMGLLPSFAFRILDQPYGVAWFIFLLSVVFAGDIFAYTFGVLFGRHKVMPAVSPNKTWQGSIGGVFGSLVASFACVQLLLPHYSLGPMLLLGVMAGGLGQLGDFFESLLKRVADVKDSGKIMPGHGGILDRIDGVLFAAPVILIGILTISHFSL